MWAQVCVGCQKVWCILLHGIVCVFSHPTHYTYEWVMSPYTLHVWMRYGARMTASCQAYECVMPHLWTRHVAHMNESCLTYEWVMSHIWMSHVSHIVESCLIYECVMSHTWMSHVSSFPLSQVYMSHVTHMNESCHTYEWVMSHIWMSHNASFHTHDREKSSHIWMIYVTYLLELRRKCVISHIRTSHVEYTNESCRTNEWVMSHI